MMRIIIDDNEITVEAAGTERHDIASPEAFAILSEAWMRSSWANRHSYTFSWLGRPVIQLPSDLLRLQELVWQQRPDVIIETGVAHGGSLVFLAGLCRLIGHGRVVGVDIDIRPHNRKAIEAHALADLITLIEGDSAAPGTVDRVRTSIGGPANVLVILDSNHGKSHVRAELEAYAPMVRPGGHVVVADGNMAGLVGLPGARDDWSWNNPAAALTEFLAANSEFERASPPVAFNEGGVAEGPTYWPGGYIRRVR
ncbi:class I SAM-dependent methyltransferase [Bradyrhizobium diazoefficiens]|nr:CmcI family methyltransferase [Bradyrhizobium diazoefficiens]MBR0774594.1 class I SAM-dependent methyltransferase [Bradyrhizobium diazoefficiens]